MVKSALRCASPEQEVQGLSGLRSSSDGPEAAEPPQKQRKKEFAWMDSDDEVSDSPAKVPRAEASSPKRSPESDGSGSEPEVPESAKDVQSLAQMMRLMESWQQRRGKILRLPMAELAQVCLACARVKYFDAQNFQDIVAAVKVHLRSYLQLKAEDVGSVLSGLADVNAYDKELFELAAQALNRTAGHLQRPARKVILDAFKKVKHRSENAALREMAEQEAKARYDDMCSEVAASWQRPGAHSTTWRSFG